LAKRLYQEVEGSFSGRYGYIVSVVHIVSISKGLILPSMGAAQFSISYAAIVFKPYKGEVLDAQVTQVNQVSRTFEFDSVLAFKSD
jgi:DNA-directed RNA polymerase II subunit RPB7